MATTMATETAADRVKREFNRAFDTMRADLDRIEILAAALGAFSKPVPDYEPCFRHISHLMRNVQEFGQPAGAGQ